MEFKKFSAGMNSYGTSETHSSVQYEKGVTNVNFYDEDFEL